MRIRRLAMTDYRCFAGAPVEIDEIGDGITLIAGDNEEGKSTVLAALQTVLFEKHTVTGGAATDMLPYGAKVQPRIELDFEAEGSSYQLVKAFCQRPEANLMASNGDRWAGDAAEDELRRILEFTPPGRGAAKAEHRGMQALFWVEQGAAFHLPQITDTIHARLAAALEAEVGTVTGGERGRALIKRIEDRMGSFLTAANRRPTGPFKEAAQRVEEARQKVEGLAADLALLEEKTDSLERVREQLQRLESDEPIEAAEKRLVAAREAVKAVESLEGKLQTARAELQAAQTRRELVQSTLARRKEDRESAEQAGRESETAATEENDAKAAVAEAQETVDSARIAHAETKKRLEEARANADKWHRIADLLDKRRRLSAEEERLHNAAKASQQVSDLNGAAKAETITDDVLSELRRLEQEVRDNRARLDAVATKLEFRPEGDNRAIVDLAPLPEEAVTLVEPTEITLEGYGSVRVTPGGDDLSLRRDAAEQAEQRLGEVLRTHHAANVADATYRAQKRERDLADADVLQNTVDAHAPEGIDALTASVTALRAEVETLASEVGDDDSLDQSPEDAADKASSLLGIAASTGGEERETSDALKVAEGKLGAASGV